MDLTGSCLVSDRAVLLVEERELEAITRLRVLAIGLRLEQVVPRHGLVVRDDLPILLRAEELLLHEHVFGSAVRAWPHNVSEGRPAAPIRDLPQHAPHVDAFHVGGGLTIEHIGEIPLLSAEVDVLLDGSPAPQGGDLEEVLPRPRFGVFMGARHRRLLAAQWAIVHPQMPLAIGAVRPQLVRAVHDGGPGLYQHSSSRASAWCMCYRPGPRIEGNRLNANNS
jgi:hypothetical protein